MATLATPGDIKAVAPEFGNLSDPVIQVYIDMADEEIDADAWGSRAKTAEIYLTCHKMIISGAKDGEGAGGGASGPVQSVRVGEVSVTYAAPAQGSDSSLSSSRYGVEYARLMRLAGAGGMVLNGVL